MIGRDPRARLRGQMPPQEMSYNRQQTSFMTGPNFDDSALNDSRLSANESRMQFMKPPRAANRRVAFEEEDFASTTEGQLMIEKPNMHNFRPKSDAPKLIRRIQINFGAGTMQNKLHKFTNNYVSTTKYSLLTFLPKSLIMQFMRVANIYFLVITILTNLSFSPKQPASQIMTFVMVLFFTMVKEGFEDLQRFKQDREVNKAPMTVFSREQNSFKQIKCEDIQVGDLVRVERDQAFPADILLLGTSAESGIAFVNTINLDGETNLKEKICLKETKQWSIDEILHKAGMIDCEGPSEYLEAWEGNIQTDGRKLPCDIKQLCLRGTTLKNTEFILGIAVYTGHHTKLMKNAKHPRSKMSKILRKMNQILISVFVLQAFIILTFSTISMKWQDQNGTIHYYLHTDNVVDFKTFFIRYFTFLVAYSHLIPISLYVALEVFKLIQGYFIKWDEEMYYKPLDKRANVRASDLVEEIGQVEIIFSDKTGTLTMNEMEFKKCSVNHQIFGNNGDPNKEKDKFTINGDTSAFESLIDPNENKHRQPLADFFTLLAVCHTVIPEHDPQTNQVKYQASSPDELALVEGAARMGFEFVNRTSSFIEIQLFTGEIQQWEVFGEFPFDSTRKRMSLIVRRRGYEDFLLMSKGADSIMIPRLVQDQSSILVTQRHLEGFANDGLRTLIVAQKRLDSMTAMNILNKFEQLKVSGDPQKEQKLAKFYDSLECDLTFVGCTAIEDKLQEGVPETISCLMQAGIKIWVLTGDKQETAIEIAKSCKLVQTGMDIAILTSKSHLEFLEVLDKNITHYHVELNGPVSIDEGSQNQNQKLVHKIAIVIDGSTLTYALESDLATRNKFFRLSLIANSVICCRVSPKQKADVVNLAKSYGPWTTLAVGDGANDVSMIREAHVGVGIYGKEGTQAARTADFAIGQFRYLQKLLLVHGRLSYKRVSNFILYYFYKNVILVFTEVYFAFYNGFSGQVYFADWLPMLYNVLWTSWPPVVAFALERDVSSESVYRYPKLYRAGPKHYYFNMGTFWIWMAYAGWHGVISFFTPVFNLNTATDSSGQMKSHWWVSTVSFTLIMHFITYKLLLQTSFWHIYGVLSAFLALVFYYVTVLIMSVDSISKLVQPEINGVLPDVLGTLKGWIMIIGVPMVGLAPDIILQVLKRTIKPNPADKVLRMELQGVPVRKRNLQSKLSS